MQSCVIGVIISTSFHTIQVHTVGLPCSSPGQYFCICIYLFNHGIKNLLSAKYAVFQQVCTCLHNNLESNIQYERRTTMRKQTIYTK